MARHTRCGDVGMSMCLMPRCDTASITAFCTAGVDPIDPLGAKGIGEAGSIGSTPAVQNAVIDAVSHFGVRHIDMPTSPQRVWRAIQAANGSKEA